MKTRKSILILRLNNDKRLSGMSSTISSAHIRSRQTRISHFAQMNIM